MAKLEIQTNYFFYGVLHNRKTAGTALKALVELQKQRNPLWNVICFNHDMTFSRFVETYPNALAIFFIRDPISRFVSGFYSRLRQGKPRYDFPWSRKEAKAFARFSTPNQLAEALTDKRFLTRYAARKAMKSIQHVKHTYVDFLGSLAFLEKHTDHIYFIGHQSEFDADLVILRKLLQIQEDIQLQDDDVQAHRNPSDVDKKLSETAKNNLRKWYKADFEIYEWCLRERLKINIKTV